MKQKKMANKKRGTMTTKNRKAERMPITPFMKMPCALGRYYDLIVPCENPNERGVYGVSVTFVPDGFDIEMFALAAAAELARSGNIPVFFAQSCFLVPSNCFYKKGGLWVSKYSDLWDYVDERREEIVSIVGNRFVGWDSIVANDIDGCSFGVPDEEDLEEIKSLLLEKLSSSK